MGQGVEMGNDKFENRGGKSIRSKSFDPARYEMAACPDCGGGGYIQNPERQCCPKCGGFGFVKNESERDIDISPIIEK